MDENCCLLQQPETPVLGLRRIARARPDLPLAMFLHPNVYPVPHIGSPRRRCGARGLSERLLDSLFRRDYVALLQENIDCDPPATCHGPTYSLVPVWVVRCGAMTR